jgi:hypothetical protein
LGIREGWLIDILLKHNTLDGAAAIAKAHKDEFALLGFPSNPTSQSYGLINMVANGRNRYTRKE